MDKGTFSNLVSASCFGLGLALPAGPVQALVLSTGMFAFSGGITNTVAVKMLFDRVPGLVGSGVIPARFREIRTRIRQLIVTHFFDPTHVKEYIRDHAGDLDFRSYLKGGRGPGGRLSDFVETQWEKLASPAALQPIVDRHLEKLMDSPMGGLLVMVGMDNVRPAVTQFVSGFVSSLKGRVQELSASLGDGVDLTIDEEKVARDLRTNLEKLLDAKLQQLDAQTVKRMLEEVIRNHLGWLIVWGNIFGGLLGIVAFLIGKGT